MERILVIEDSKEVQLIIKECLKSYYVDSAESLEAAKKKLENDYYDLILLDIHLPDGNGFKFLSNLNSHNEILKTNIIFISVSNDPDDVVMGYTLGGNDYITKPFDIRIFKAKIESKLKQIHFKKETQQILNIHDLKINYDLQKLFIFQNNNYEMVDLTPLEFKIMSFFCNNFDIVFSRQQIIDKIWHNSVHVSDRTIDTHISHIRKKIQLSRMNILSIYGSGYSLICKSAHDSKSA